MIDQATLGTYSVIGQSFVSTLGPATRLTVTRAATSGAKVGIAAGAEITVGFNTYTMFAVIGLSAIIAASATLFSIIKLTGGAYLIWLRIKAIRAGAPVISGCKAS